MKLLIYTSIFILLNASNCSTQYDFKGIKFGEGGGFTGAVITCEVKTNGDIFVNKSLEKTQTKIKTIDKEQMKTIQDMIDKISNESWKFIHPFNVYYFIETEKGKITWGDPSYTPSAETKELYDYLNKIINQ